MERYFFSRTIPAVGEMVALSGAESRHLRGVLRAAVGTSVWLLDGFGTRARGELTAMGGRDGAVCRILARQQLQRPFLKPVLYVAPPRGKGMVRIVKQATELGVSEIVPVATARGVSRPAGNAAAAWGRQAVEACKQSGNPFLPVFREPTSFAAAAAATPAGHYGVVPDGAPGGVRRLTPGDMAADDGRVALWLGPEGGFSEEEVSILRARLLPWSCGRWVLRVETAVVAGLSWLIGEYAS